MRGPEHCRLRRPRRQVAGIGIERALESVLAEIDEIAKATLRSISIATLLKLTERRRAGRHAG